MKRFQPIEKKEKSFYNYYSIHIQVTHVGVDRLVLMYICKLTFFAFA